MRINIREIAKLAGVSPTTVSFVLNGKKGVGEETRRRVKRIIEENGYKDRISVKRQNEMSICVVKFSTDNALSFDSYQLDSYIIACMQNLCSEKNIYVTMTVCNSGNYQDVIRNLKHDGKNGVVLIGTMLDNEKVQLLEDIGLGDMPLVVIDNYMMNTHVSSITTADDKNSCLAIKYLYDAGVRSVGHLQSKVRIQKFINRESGYDDIVRELGMEAEIKVPMSLDLNSANEDMKKWLDKGLTLPRAFYADTGAIALGAMRALQEKGYRIPNDVALVVGDDIPFGTFCTPTLTSVGNSYDEICRLAIYMVERKIKENAAHPIAEHISVSGEIIIRESAPKKII